MKVTRTIRALHIEPGRVTYVEHIEWTPERPLDDTARLPSTWKDPRGKKLTNRAILAYALQGKYGEAERNRALAEQKKRSVTASGLVIRCRECQAQDSVLYYRFGYLPTPGYYCSKCLAGHRIERDKAKTERAEFRNLFLAEFQ